MTSGVRRPPRRKSVSRQAWALWTVVAAVLVGGSLFLWMRGRAPAPQSGAVTEDASRSVPAPLSASQVERGVEEAEAAVKSDPGDAGAWAMLAHTHEMMGDFKKAADAYRELLKLRPKDAVVLADFADALAVAQDGRLVGEPAELIRKALALQPDNLKALVLGGKEAFERQRFDEAIGLWQRALAVAPDEPIKLSIRTSIAEAKALSTPDAKPRESTAGLGFVAGRVTVSERLKARIDPDDTVFIFARPADGSRMPVALLRRHGRDLPALFALDDSLAMVANVRLSQHPKVIVGVRVSKRGNAIPAPGDLEAEVGPVELGSTGLKLEIDRVRE